jgi:hypothetical protein
MKDTKEARNSLLVKKADYFGEIIAVGQVLKWFFWLGMPFLVTKHEINRTQHT